jgi:hypothetical protein
MWGGIFRLFQVRQRANSRQVIRVVKQGSAIGASNGENIYIGSAEWGCLFADLAIARSSSPLARNRGLANTRAVIGLAA